MKYDFLGVIVFGNVLLKNHISQICIRDSKYTICELTELLKQEDKPVYVAVDEDDLCMGYAFCQLREQPFSTNMVSFKSLFIDDLCVDKQARGQRIGESLFEYVKQQAKELGCYEVTLNVWTGNTSAEDVYKRQTHFAPSSFRSDVVSSEF